MPTTLTDVAKRAKVSYNTVSEIVNLGREHKFAPGTVERVKQAARALDYQTNYFATSLKSGKTNIIGVSTGGRNMVKEFTHVYFANVYNGLGQTLADTEYKLLFHDFNEYLELATAEGMARSRLVDGIVFIVFNLHMPRFITWHKRIHKKLKLRSVVIHSMAEPAECDNVGLDCFHGGREAAKHFLEHGYSSFGFVKLPPNRGLYHDMRLGYQEYLTGKKVPLKKENIFTAQAEGAQAGYECAALILRQNKELPRALLVSGDGIAQGMMARFSEAGISVPDDVALIGFGDLVGENNVWNTLTTVKQPAIEKGKKAMEILLDRLAHPEKPFMDHIFKAGLTIRKSCGCK